MQPQEWELKALFTLRPAVTAEDGLRPEMLPVLIIVPTPTRSIYFQDFLQDGTTTQTYQTMSLAK
jgi:hypothetical protein